MSSRHCMSGMPAPWAGRGKRSPPRSACGASRCTRSTPGTSHRRSREADVTTLTRFAPLARRTVVRAGMLASEYGRDRLSTEFFLLALAEDQPLSRPVDLGITAAMIRAEIRARTAARQDRELLAAIGIDLDEVRR